MYDIITKANAIEFFEKVELDNETTEKNTNTKSFSPFHTARARKARGDRRRKAAERHRGQRDGKRHYKRDEKEYSYESISHVTPSNSDLIRRGIKDYYDDIEEKEIEELIDLNNIKYLRLLCKWRDEAILEGIRAFEKAKEIDKEIAAISAAILG